MSNKMQEKEIDERIRQAFQGSNPEIIEDLIDLSTFEGTQIWNRLILEGELSAGLLQDILIARDKKVLGLKNCEISEVYAEELKLEEEFAAYNVDIPQDSEITVIQGKDKNGKNNICIYYADYKNNWATRQQRIFNENGDIESMHRQTIFSDGRCEHIDDAIMVYDYDRHGNKKAGLYRDDLTGMKYFEYDKAGNIKLEVAEEYIMQKCVQWFSGFAKRLEMDPKLAVQDEAVMSTMRGAVGKTVGTTRNAEMDLKTPVEKEIKEKERGNN